MEKLTKLISVICLISGLICGSNISLAQEFLGYSNSNYAGLYGIDLQPASIVDSRLAFDINFPFIGFNVGASNNFLKLGNASLIKIENPQPKNLFLNTDLLLPSFMININNKHSLAFSTNFRNIFNINNVSSNFAETLFDSVINCACDTPNISFNDLLNNTTIDSRTMAWTELGLTYGTIILNKKKHFLKGAITLKYLRGIAGGYFNFRNTDSEEFGDSAVFIKDMNLSYGFSDGITDLFDSTANLLFKSSQLGNKAARSFLYFFCLNLCN